MAGWRAHAAVPLHDWPPVVLGSEVRSWSVELPARASTRSFRLGVESALANSAGLMLGSPVIEVRTVGQDGTPNSRWLAAGVDTGEWAAARDQLPAPRAASSWVDPSGRFFAQRYSSAIPIARVAPGSRLEIVLAPGLDRAVEATLFRVSLFRVSLLAAERHAEDP